MRQSRCFAVVSMAAFVALSATAVASAANLHFIMFADTLDPTIGTDVDLEDGLQWVQTIASNTGLTLRTHTLSGDGLTVDASRAMLSELDPGEDDVVYFVYSGHGANGGASDWPVFTYLTGGNPVTFDEVVATLEPKSQRMLLVVSDCCNVLGSVSGRRKPPPEPSGQSSQTVANYQKLFLDFRGTILATAAGKGQYSFGDSVNGGVFLSTFMQDFQSLADSSSSLTWEAVLSRTRDDVNDEITEYILSDSDMSDIVPQNPVYEIQEVAGENPGDPNDPGTDGTSDTNAAPQCGPMSVLPLAVCVGSLLIGRRRWRK